MLTIISLFDMINDAIAFDMYNDHDLIKRAETFAAYKDRIEQGLEIVQKKDITNPQVNLTHEEQKDLNLALQYNMRLMIALLQ